MLVCNGCHRHVRVEALACPFCGATITLIAAPSYGRLGSLALTAGLGLLACSDRDDDCEGMTTNDNCDNITTLGDGNDDPSETTEVPASEYGGADTNTDDGEESIPCAAYDPIPAFVGLNDVTVAGPSALQASCGASGPESIYSFVAQVDGEHTFTVLDATFEATLYVVDGICVPADELACVTAPESVTLSLTDGQTVYVVVDSSAAEGTASLEITTM